MSFALLTAEQLQPILAAYRQRLHPRVLKECEANSSMLAGWLQAKDRAVNVDSLMAATSALKDSLVWDVAPKRQSEPDQRIRGDQSGLTNQVGIVDAAVKKFDAENDKKILLEVASIIQNHRAKYHSTTFKQRDQLTAELNRLMASNTKPAQIKDIVLAMQNSFPA